jgi:AcrR family transcriptional regulator
LLTKHHAEKTMKKDVLGEVERGRGERAGLDLDRILRAARRIGHDKLSMQALADALNVDRKALNYHVKDRQTLLALVAKDTLTASFSSADIAHAATWQDACRTYATHLVDAAVAMGGLAEHLRFDDSELMSWNLLPTEELLEQLYRAGFSEAAAVRLAVLLAALCVGHVKDIWQARSAVDRTRPRQLQKWLDSVDGKSYSRLRQAVALGIDTYGPEQLDFSLRIFIAGAEAHLAS